MKITVSFVRKPRMIRAAIALTWSTAVVLGSLGATLLADMLASRAEAPQLAGRVAALQSQERAVSKPRLPAADQLADMRARVRFLNSVSGVRGWNTSQFLAWLEERLPENVQLLSLHHKARGGEVLLIAESASAAHLTELLQRLEREPAFAEVLLSKQSAQASETAELVRFEIKLRIRS
jgi:hypothetical protein